MFLFLLFFFFSSRRRHTRCSRDWSSDVCSSDLIMTSWLERQGRYRDLIVSHLRAAHLPEDLLYDAMIESSYDNDDLSSAGALGLWQMMKAAGSIYGLRQDRWVDE